MKALITIAVLAIIVIGAVAIFGGSAEKGTVYVAITDAAVDLENVSEITMEVSDLHFDGEAATDVHADLENETFNLLELRDENKAMLLSEIELNTGTYDSITIELGEIIITNAEGDMVVAVLPARTLTLNTIVEVEADSTTVIVLDVLADQSLHTADNGAYVFAPVIETQVHSGTTAQIEDDGSVLVGESEETTTTTFGTDIDGSVKTGFTIDTTETIKINEEGGIDLTGRATTTNDTNVDTGVDADVEVENGVDINL